MRRGSPEQLQWRNELRDLLTRLELVPRLSEVAAVQESMLDALRYWLDLGSAK